MGRSETAFEKDPGRPNATRWAAPSLFLPSRGPAEVHKFIDMMGAAQVGILHRDISRSVISVNARFCELVGLSPSELDGLPIDAFIHPADIGRSGTMYRRHLERAEPFQIETRYCRPDGSICWCELHVSFDCDVAGKAVSTITVAIDISARKQAEQELREREAHHRSSMELASQINWTANPNGTIEEVSPRWAEVTGILPEDALGVGWLRALHPEDISPAVAAWTQALEAKTPVDVEYRLRTPEGEHRWFRARAAARFDENRNVVRWHGTLEDIDDRKRAENALRESEERFRLAAQAARLGIWDYDAVLDRREWSDDFKDMLGLARDTVADVETALSLVVPADRHLLQSLVQAVRLGDNNHHFDVTLRIHRADTGEERWMQTSGWRIQAASGHLERILVTIRDVTEERTSERRIHWMATHDVLTRLPNRAYFNEAFDGAIGRAEKAGTKLGLVLFDVDNLKATNDTIGHDAGDLLLQTFATRLSATAGPRTFVGRLGGDEFAAFFEVDDEAHLSVTINQILPGLCFPFGHDGGSIDCQATAGASLFPRDGASSADVLKAADIALYAGKAHQRGMLSLFRPELRANLQRRASMLAVARTVLRDDRITPFYQPKIQFSDQRVAGFEALLRWHHPVRGIQHPDTIVAAFDDYNLATDLGERMFDRICQDMRHWLDLGLDFGSVAFNLSPAEFRRVDLCDRMLGQLHRSGIPAHLLELEITESVFLGRSAETVSQTMAAFHREGVRIALDDFGTGYASLTHLQAFPVDVIKIDRSFVSEISETTENAAIVDAIIGLASQLGMDVVAEGIETPAQARYLADRGCAFGQGYLFGRAVSAEQVGAMIRQR
jgi:diguanylate cyclase (GGDEF)-like protein/PAS domain S-box-containing protein